MLTQKSSLDKIEEQIIDALKNASDLLVLLSTPKPTQKEIQDTIHTYLYNIRHAREKLNELIQSQSNETEKISKQKETQIIKNCYMPHKLLLISSMKINILKTQTKIALSNLQQEIENLSIRQLEENEKNN
ncbi:hypothetical protein M0813_13923 [Anaeramoeba flamelloides]|uniref:Mediator of RNA polymerase II transcription subunit 11 n=1 Tax=Anaeramoeba flamelloides TaxID=1746091 RepID=A0AAV8AGC8_9EUKA|nr:hypothetical protein M0812_03766 [Anaeramoeba flamelloides]KAJ6252713.1 hypothetical protein M0813_13923 [Anaeramoeba flamelloides]